MHINIQIPHSVSVFMTENSPLKKVCCTKVSGSSFLSKIPFKNLLNSHSIQYWEGSFFTDTKTS